ncbi:MAG: trypsin-like peptidase domain-containing protein [Thermoguttaceae bacterium]|nr:trypsin-like peptidase domain-containing protein [Thermoguttaceae bacterium]
MKKILSKQSAAPRAFAALFCALFLAAPICRGVFAEERSEGLGATRPDPAVASSASREVDKASGKETDPFRRDARGVQTYFPAVVKIVGQAPIKVREDGAQTVPFFYGTGTYVAERRELGVVLTNWHVVSEATDSVEVAFPNGVRYPARVILRDETWDLAALLIPRPNDVFPLPISLERPRINDVFWVGGYGQANDLADFQMKMGKLTNFVALVNPDDVEEIDGKPTEIAQGQTKKYSAVAPRASGADPKSDALYETLSISQGVRQGDSGGPIFNRYGEIAGILWGSDGKCTMGTACERLHSFLMQAILRSSELYASERIAREEAGTAKLDFFRIPFAPPTDCPVAKDSEIPMGKLWTDQGPYPVSTRPIYGRLSSEPAKDFRKVDRKGAVEFVRNASLAFFTKNGLDVPPSPPLYSPTFIVRQKATNSLSPEVIDDRFAAALDSYGERVAESARRKAAKSEEVEVVEPRASAGKDASESPTPVFRTASFAASSDAPSPAEAQARPEEAPAKPVESAQEPEPPKVVAGTESADASEDAKAKEIPPATEPSAAPSEDEKVEEESTKTGVEKKRTSDLATYFMATAVFFVFFFATRFLNGETGRERRERREKRRESRLRSNA